VTSTPKHYPAHDPRRTRADVPLVCSYDLHANVSDQMVACCDAFVGYRTNPHLDMRERGANRRSCCAACSPVKEPI